MSRKKLSMLLALTMSLGACFSYGMEDIECKEISDQFKPKIKRIYNSWDKKEETKDAKIAEVFSLFEKGVDKKSRVYSLVESLFDSSKIKTRLSTNCSEGRTEFWGDSASYLGAFVVDAGLLSSAIFTFLTGYFRLLSPLKEKYNDFCRKYEKLGYSQSLESLVFDFLFSSTKSFFNGAFLTLGFAAAKIYMRSLENKSLYQQDKTKILENKYRLMAMRVKREYIDHQVDLIVDQFIYESQRSNDDVEDNKLVVEES